MEGHRAKAAQGHGGQIMTPYAPTLGMYLPCSMFAVLGLFYLFIYFFGTAPPH
jgi:hypothetical protein